MPGIQKFRRIIAQTKLRDLLLWWRHRGLRISDIFLASYPRSGSNWVKFLVLESILGAPVDFHRSDLLMPYVGSHSSAPPILPGGRRFLKSHERYRTEYKKALYLVRDPRAVVVSEFRQHRDLRKYTGTFEHFLVDFMNGQVNGFGSWAAHVQSWVNADPSSVKLVKFEDLRADPMKTVLDILYFLDVEPAPGAVEKAVNNNTIERMREKEDQARSGAERMDMIKNLRGDSRFVNDGTVRGWETLLETRQIRMIEQHAGEWLNRLGYDHYPAVES